MKKTVWLCVMWITVILGLCGCASQKETEQETPIWFAEADMCSYSANGFFSSEGGYIYYTDAEEGVKALICDDPKCTHQKDECPAYVDATITRAFVYKQKLYLLTNYEQEVFGELFLYRANANGTERKQLAKVSDNVQFITRVYLYGSRMFFIYSNPQAPDMTPLEDRVMGVFFYDLETGDTKKIFETTELIMNIQYEDCCLYFSESLHDGTMRIYSCRVNEDASELILPDASETFHVDHGNVFYLKEGTLYQYQTAEKVTETISGIGNTGYFFPVFENDFLLLTSWENEKSVYRIYDLNSRALQQIENDGMMPTVVIGDVVYGSEDQQSVITDTDSFQNGVSLAHNRYRGTDESRVPKQQSTQEDSGRLIWMVPEYAELYIDPVNEKLREDGCEFQVVLVPEGGDYTQRVVDAVESGKTDLVSLGFAEIGDDRKLDMIRNGGLYDLSDYLSTEDGKRLFSKYDPAIWKSVSVDGKYSLVQNQVGAYGMAEGMVFQKKFYDENLLREEALFTESLKKLFEQVKDRDLEYPVLWNITVDSEFALCGFAHVGGAVISLEDGRAYNLYETERFREYMKLLAEARTQGYLKRIPIQSDSQWEDILKAGNYGMIAGVPYHRMTEAYADRFWMKHMPFTVHSMISGLGIAANSNKTEEALRFLNLLYTDLEYGNLLIYGKENEDYILEDGFVKAPNGDDLSGFTNKLVSGLFDEVYPAETDYFGAKKREGKAEALASDAYRPSVLNGFQVRYGEWSDAVAALDEMLMDNTQIWQSNDTDADIDAAMDALSARYKELGGEEWVAELNRQIGEWQATGGNE